ncbi:MAG: helix-turn-helix transcriptional regulator [Lachnospiraceae bacterium]|nr:helix-turn-helix transcriptional regulator [Lachnospiraceae bacterium]
MDREGLIYICRTMGDLAGIPVRILSEGECIYFHSTTGLKTDPAAAWKKELDAVTDNVGYLITEDLHNFGVINAKGYRIIVGPSRQIGSTDRELREIAFRTGVPVNEISGFLSGMKAIVRMPLESMLQMLCAVNFAISGEKTELEQIQITGHEQADLLKKEEIYNARKAADREKNQEMEEDDALISPAVHNTLALEETVMDMIRRGDTEGLEKWLKSAPSVRGGVLAAEQLRQKKNLFIVTATLASRAAIRGGLDPGTALALSDRYIQNCEIMTSPNQITNLSYHMVLEYTRRVAGSIRPGSRLAAQAADYVRDHLTEPISVAKMAETMYVSRPYLSRRFKADTGESITDYILRNKAQEAGRLLSYTDRSAADIGNYLGFSSQGHFSRVFTKYMGMTPGEYRNRHTLSGHELR